MRGFTLIELVVVMAVVAILAAIALPNFQDSVRKSRRSEAKAELQGRQLRMEQWRANRPTFVGHPIVANTTGAHYDFPAPTNVTATTYTLTATAKGSQTADAQAGTNCSTLTISIVANNATPQKTPAACW